MWCVKALRVLVAPDKYKGSLTAPRVAAAVVAGLRDADPRGRYVPHPVADGGDGTAELLLDHGFTAHGATVTGPLGGSVRVRWAARGDRAVVELAAASGLALLGAAERDPLNASTAGTGETIAAAVRAGARAVVVGVGGSATSDGGAGLLFALGARLRDAAGAPVPEGLAGLDRAVALDLAPVRESLGGATVTVASDVTNPLLGPAGAAAVFAPQKGADPGQVAVLERRLARWADLVEAAAGRRCRDVPGAGAAGGTGFALAALGADIRPGIDLFLDLSGFGVAVRGVEVVITGEGRLDQQSLGGKAPVGVARAAAAAGVPTVAIAGDNLLTTAQARAAGFAAAYGLTDIEPDRERCVRDAAALLIRRSREVAADLRGIVAHPGR